MEYKKHGVTHVAFKEFKLSDGSIIGIFQGNRGENPDLDIRICYKDKYTKGNKRTPKHIHWVIDLLIKKEHNSKLTLELIKYFVDMYDKVPAFRTKEEQQKCELRETSHEKLQRFEELDKYGNYSVEFIGHLVELMIRMEKTGLAKAYVFERLLKESLLEEKDIFSIVAAATQTGR